MAGRRATFELIADSSKFESGMASAARAADTGAEKIEAAAKKADRMSTALDSAGNAADASESKFVGVADIASGMGDLFGIEALGPIAATGLALGDLTGGFAQLAPVMTGAIDKIKNLSVVTKLQSAAQGALNLVMSMNPIFLVVAAIVVLIGIFVLAYTKCETFREIVNAAFEAVKNVVMGVFNWIKDNWHKLFEIFSAPIRAYIGVFKEVWGTIKDVLLGAYNWIKEKVEGVVGFFTGLPGKIADIADTIKNAVLSPFKRAFNAIGDIWNSTVGKLSFKVPDWVPGIGGKGFDMPDIPEWKAAGGSVFAGSPYVVGELGPELFVPRTAGTIVPNGAGGGNTYNLHVQALDATSAATAVMRAIEEFEARNGTKFARAS